MPGRIRDEDIELVRSRSPLGEVVGEYLQLRSAGGGSLKGLCPFHEEKTPSFNVTPARGLWYCFSCAEGGDVIAFVRKIDNLGFTEAVERLAARAGIELRYEQGGHVPGQEQSRRRRLIEAHRAAADFYSQQFLTASAAHAREFLAARGFEVADAQRFGVGYAPDDWEATTRHLRGRGFTEDELITGGLAGRGRHGLVDKFRGRLIWPIRDLSGDVIAFGARKLSADDSGPKYLNTPESPIFKKSSVLYGADLAKRDIAQRRQAVIVEGYTDVMACHLAGVTTAVATSGTSFGEGHISILRRLLMDDSLRGEVIFTFDGDAAGQRAALRAFAMEEKFVTQTFVAVQPDGLDPCDLRLKEGDAAVRDLVASRLPLYEFAVRAAMSEYDLESAEGRIAALDAAAKIVARIKDHALRKVYAVKVDRWLGLMDEELVLGRVAEHIGRDADRGGARRGRADRGIRADRAGGAVRSAAVAGDSVHRPGADGQGAGGRQGAGSRQGTGSGRGPESGQGAGSGRGPESGQGPGSGQGAGSGQGPGSGQSGSESGGAGQLGPSGAADQGHSGPGAVTRGRSEPPGYDPGDPVVNLERQALKLAIQRPALLGPAFDGMGPDAFTAPAHRAVREMIGGCGGVATAGPPREWVDRLLEAAPNDNARMFLTRLAVEPIEAPGAAGEPDVKFADYVLTRIEELAVSRQITAVKSRLQRMNPVTEQADYNRMFGDLVALEQRRKLLNERTGGA
ncbi:MAG TPA: DNA primase [Streptosporangiaceae bacterium]